MKKIKFIENRSIMMEIMSMFQVLTSSVDILEHFGSAWKCRPMKSLLEKLTYFPKLWRVYQQNWVHYNETDQFIENHSIMMEIMSIFQAMTLSFDFFKRFKTMKFFWFYKLSMLQESRWLHEVTIGEITQLCHLPRCLGKRNGPLIICYWKRDA